MIAMGLPDTYQALLAIAERQAEALEREDVEGFTALGAERDGVFERLQAQEHEMAGLSEPERGTIGTVIQRILALDGAIEDRLTALTRNVRRELSTLHTGLSALNSYGAAAGRDALFIDRNS